MHVEHFEFLHKDEGSNVVNCPSISRATDPEGYIVNGIPMDTGTSGTGQPSIRPVARGYIVSGIPVDDSTYARIPQTGPGEWAVFVPAGVIDGTPVDTADGALTPVFVPANVIDRVAVPA